METALKTEFIETDLFFPKSRMKIDDGAVYLNPKHFSVSSLMKVRQNLHNC